MLSWLKDSNLPILTTNFDSVLEKTLYGESVKKKKMSLLKEQQDENDRTAADKSFFTDRYPWTTYFSNETLELTNLHEKSSVWHVHGMIEYQRSVRLGMEHYAGMIHRFRIMRDGDNGLYIKNQMWIGRNSWLDLFFHRNIVVIGFGLTKDETFLRWLFLERKRYYKHLAGRSDVESLLEKERCLYLCTEGENLSLEQRFYLNTCGFEVIELPSYEDLYENLWKNWPTSNQ